MALRWHESFTEFYAICEKWETKQNETLEALSKSYFITYCKLIDNHPHPVFEGHDTF